MKQLAEERKTERITARVTENVRETLEYAASIQGATVNQFLLSSALKNAEEVIERERQMRLSLSESKAYLDLLANPPKPNNRMKAALKSYTSGPLHV